MKKVLLAALFVTSVAFSQNPLVDEAAKEFENVNKAAVINPKDLKVYNLLETFYKEALKTDDGELTQGTIDDITKLMETPETPNLNILQIFLMYQGYISEMDEAKQEMDPEFQMLTTDVLVKESTKIYKKVPTIITIYRGEALMSAEKTAEARTLFKTLLAAQPDCIPAKIYTYLLSENETERTQLAAAIKKERPNHWMVKEFLN